MKGHQFHCGSLRRTEAMYPNLGHAASARLCWLPSSFELTGILQDGLPASFVALAPQGNMNLSPDPAAAELVAAPPSWMWALITSTPGFVRWLGAYMLGPMFTLPRKIGAERPTEERQLDAGSAPPGTVHCALCTAQLWPVSQFESYEWEVTKKGSRRGKLRRVWNLVLGDGKLSKSAAKD